jgi:hypothetical protein
MTENIDKRIEKIKHNLHLAHKKSEKYFAKEISRGKKIKPIDFYESRLAWDTEKLLQAELDLLLSKKYPQWYTR